MAEQDTQGGAADRQDDDTGRPDDRPDATKTPVPASDDSDDAGGSGAGYGNHGDA